MEPRAVAEIIGHEHPQVIAIILSYFSPDHSADILEYLPDETRVDVLVRLATLESIQPSAIKELNNIVEKQFSHGIKNEINSTNIDGLIRAANILKHSDISIENEIIDNINEDDPELGQRLMDAMFIFEDLVDLEDKDIQTILREITSESLVVALKGSDDALKEKIFNNMSKRAGRMLREDMEDRGPVRLREVEYAKKEIILVARRLAAAGDISLGKPGTTIYV
jgi:flagellar motor switch protein FliG